MGPKRKIAAADGDGSLTRKKLRPRNINVDTNKNESLKIKKVKKEVSSQEIFLSNLEQKVISRKSKGYQAANVKKEITDDVTTEQKPTSTSNIDKECPIADSCHIYLDSDSVWDCMLNQTNIEFNNNKYYLIQLLKKSNSKKDEYYVWMRWGRIGLTGQNSLKSCGTNLEAAKNIFKQKFSDKTKNDWEDRDSFEKVQGKYDLIYLDQQPAEDVLDSGNVKQITKVESNLELNVKNLIELICDVKAMEQSLVELSYDSKRAPLGKLTEDQVVAGYAALKSISEIIDSSDKRSRKPLLQACNIYYTRIPHSFRMKIPPLIDTRAQIEVEMILLNALADIQAAMNVVGKIHDNSKNPTDEYYERLQCNIFHLDKKDDEFKLVEKYIKTTHGETHNLYTLNVEHVYKIEKLVQKKKMKDVGNHMLLWHGSRKTNWAGILSQGLRIAPPEAPSTGYMFGKGIYFSDMVSKSANYCNASPSTPRGILVLCDVALGKPNKLLQADIDANKLPSGCNSVQGCGKAFPDPKNLIKLHDGMLVPMGPAMMLDDKSSEGYCLQYNEFIVYNPLQVKMKYLIQVKFDYSFNK